MSEHRAPDPKDLGFVITDPGIRRTIYTAYTLALLIIGASAAAYLALGVGLPPWVIACNAVLTYLGIPVGTLAIGNITKKEHP